MQKKIFVIDDDESIIKLIKQTLQAKSGNEFSVEGFLNAEIALDKNLSAIDLILLDYEMPGMDGIAALQEIKQNYPDMLVIMLTGNRNQSVAVQAYREGASEFIEKPFDRDFLLLAVRRVFAEHETEKNLRQTKIARQIAEARLKTVTDMAATLQHKINNPLTAIMLDAETARKKGSRECREIIEQAKRIKGLLDEATRLKEVTTEPYTGEGEEEELIVIKDGMI